jgi:hypothetical protein
MIMRSRKNMEKTQVNEIYGKLVITGQQIDEAKNKIEVHETQIKDLQQQEAVLQQYLR